MLQAARKKINANEYIHFIHGTESQIPGNIMFDVVITNFFLDLFPEEKLKSVIFKINKSLRNNGSWFVSDFKQHGKWWQNVLLFIMYRFFRVVCHIEANKLPSWNEELLKGGFRREKNRLFYYDFIESAIYRKDQL
jgi:hypothetical protein